MVWMQLSLPEELNKKLRMYVLEEEHNSKEEATEYILNKFLDDWEKKK